MTDFTPMEAPAREAQALPVMLAARLVGREAVLQQVYGELKQGRAVLLHGQPGVGKTALAAALGSAYTQQPGGVLWFNVTNPTLEELLVRVGRAYHVAEIYGSDTPLGMIGAVDNTLKRFKPLVVIDGRIDGEVAARFIARCASGLPAIVIRDQAHDGPWTAIDLLKLEPEAAAALYKQEGRVTTSATDIDIYGLAKVLDYSPFGVVIAARAMVVGKQIPPDYLKILEQIAPTSGGSSPLVGLTASFRSLNGPLQGVQGLLLMLGATVSGMASNELLSLISGVPVETVSQAMTIAAQLNLVERSQRGGEAYYRLHAITHAFVQNVLRASNRLDDLQNRARQALLAYARKYSSGAADAHVRLAVEMENFFIAARYFSENGDRTFANDLVFALTQAGDFVNSRGYLYEALTMRALAKSFASAFPAYSAGETRPERITSEFDAPDFEEDSALEADAFDDLDDEDDELEFDEDDFDAVDDDEAASPEDLIGRVLASADDEDDEPLTLTPLSQRLFSGRADLQEAEEIEEETGEVLTAPPLPPAPRINLNTRDINELRASLQQVRASGDRRQQIEVLEAIGRLQVAQKVETEAISTYSEALNLYEQSDDQNGVLDTLDMLSALMVRTENSQAAIVQAQRGVKLAESLHDDATRMQLLLTLGDARQQLGESRAAAQDYSSALAIARDIDDSQNEAITLFKLGYARLDDGDATTATETWEQALRLFRAQEKRSYEGRTLGALGSAYGDMERWAEAINFHTSALYIAREVSDTEEEELQLTSLGYAHVQNNQLGEAVMRYRQALHLAFRSGDTDNMVSLIVDLARLLVESRKHVSVARLLIERAAALEPNDKDVRQIRERIDSEYKLAEAYQTPLIPIHGTAEDYASNAYRLLEG
jgi:tetratricopeptide (TPR) repeat protein